MTESTNHKLGNEGQIHVKGHTAFPITATTTYSNTRKKKQLNGKISNEK